jgi:thymidylate synthase (FAD)
VNAQSGRYTPFKQYDFYEPITWRQQSESNKQGSEGEIDSADAERLTALLTEHYGRSFELYQQALEAGVAKEQARLFLPGFGVYYIWVCKVDAHNLMHFLRLRMAADAQAEIRAYAQAIYEHFFKPVLPWTAEAYARHVLGKA